MTLPPPQRKLLELLSTPGALATKNPWHTKPTEARRRSLPRGEYIVQTDRIYSVTKNTLASLYLGGFVTRMDEPDAFYINDKGREALKND